MKIKLTTVSGIVACAFSALAFGAGAAGGSKSDSNTGPYVAIQTEPQNLGVLCFAICDGNSVDAGGCGEGQTCCGWVDCEDQENPHKECCTTFTQECQNGLQANPPSAPTCVNIW